MPPWLCKQPGGVLGGGGVAGGDVVVGDELLKATKVARALMMMKTADSQEGGRERDHHGRWKVSVWEVLFGQGAKVATTQEAPAPQPPVQDVCSKC